MDQIGCTIIQYVCTLLPDQDLLRMLKWDLQSLGFYFSCKDGMPAGMISMLDVSQVLGHAYGLAA